MLHLRDMPGIFTISLDFELHWGVFDKRNKEQRLTCYRNTIALVPELLHMFQQYQVHVTWATVASLFARSYEEWQKLSPQLKPTYANTANSAYVYIDKNGFDTVAHLASKEVLEIEQYEGQELATHTYSHYYCLEEGQTAQQFDADLKAVNAASDALGVPRPTSIVFPRNQFNQRYLSVCYQNGITVIRSNPAKWFWSAITEEKTTLVRKLLRTGDTYLPIGGKMTYPLSAIKPKEGMPLELPASRFLRSYDAKRPVLNKLRLRRILNEMTYAAEHSECYHLWWHPEQFGDYPAESLADLTIILQHYRHLQHKLGMTSLNMREYRDIIT